MTSANYKPFVDRMIGKYEGGYSWDHGDPGGPTKYGITCYDLAEHRHEKMRSMSTWAPIVRAMPLEEAEAIYVTKYARKTRFNELKDGIDCVMFDYGVNSGPSRPIRVAQSLLKLKVDGIFGPKTLEACNAADPDWFVDAMCNERLHFMHAIKGGASWKIFGHGWQARVDDLDKYCDHLVEIAAVKPEPESTAVAAVAYLPPVAPDLSEEPMAKAVHTENPNSIRDSITGASLGTAGVGFASHDLGVMVSSGLIGVLIAGGVAYNAYDRYRAKLANKTVSLPPTVEPRQA
jgi:lysozyme family protein